MKKVIKILGGLVILLVIALITLPMVFKDKIFQAVKSEIDHSVNANVLLEPENFSLSIFRNFPNFTAKIDKIAVINQAPFEGEMLFAAKELSIEIDLISALSGNLNISGILIDRPIVNILINSNGVANYDIAKTSSEAIKEEATIENDGTSDFKLSIDHWQINGGRVRYLDQQSKMDLKLINLNHSGSGDISAVKYDLETASNIEQLFFRMEDTEFFGGKTIDFKSVFAIDLDQMKFELKENLLRVNALDLAFSGAIEMPLNDAEESILIDLKYQTKEADIKGLLSLIPAVFTTDFEDLETSGALKFGGEVSGKVTENEMPSVSLALKIHKGLVKYKSLPKSIENIEVDMKMVSNKLDMRNTTVDIKHFSLNMGANPFKGNILLKNLDHPNYIKADVDGHLNLTEISEMVPMKELKMGGGFDVKLIADGNYDTLRQTFPKIKGNFQLKDGQFKYEEYPVPLEDAAITGAISNETGQLKNTVVDISKFGFLLDGEKVDGHLKVWDLDNIHWDLGLLGSIDLGKMMKIFPLDSMSLAGKISTDLKSRGNLEDAENNRFDNLQTSGSLSVADLKFSSTDLPQGLAISNSKVTFDNESVALKTFQGKVGKSPVRASGSIINYIPYLMTEHGVLKGNLSVHSELFDVNEWLTESKETEKETAIKTASDHQMEESLAFEVPKNIDFAMNTTATKVLYDNMKLTDLKGVMTVRDQQLSLQDMSFNTLGGAIAMNGVYHALDPEKPYFKAKLHVDKVSLKQAYSTMNTVKTFAPIAKILKGNFSTDFTFDGNLKKDMMPDLGTLSGNGLVELVKTSFDTESEFVKGLVDKVPFIKEKQMALNDFIMKASIEDGKFLVEPFDVKAFGYDAKVDGFTTLEGGLDYTMNTAVPVGALGGAANSLLGNLGVSLPKDQTVTLPLRVTGTFTSPKFGLGKPSGDTKSQLAAGVKGKLKDEAKNVLKDQLNKGAGKQVKDLAKSAGISDADKLLDKKRREEEVARLKKEAEAKLRREKDSLKRVLEEEAKKKLRGLFGN